jgi:hypothetical protein
VYEGFVFFYFLFILFFLSRYLTPWIKSTPCTFIHPSTISCHNLSQRCLFHIKSPSSH